MLEGRLIPLTNWLLKNMFPAESIEFVERDISFAERNNAEIRAMDVYWFFVQQVAEIAFPTERFAHGPGPNVWTSGPIKLVWPTATSFSTMFSRLSDRAHVNETGRISTFHRLDFTGQLMVDLSYGSVIYEERNDGLSPKNWLPFKSCGSLFDGAKLFSSNLRNAALRMSEFRACSFSGSSLIGVNAVQVRFVGCSFTEADIYSGAYDEAVFLDCQIIGTEIWHASFMKATFTRCVFKGFTDHRTQGRRVIATKIVEGDFNGAEFGETRWDKSKWKDCSFKNVSFSDGNIAKADVTNCDFKGVVAARMVVNDRQMRYLSKAGKLEAVEVSSPERMPTAPHKDHQA